MNKYQVKAFVEPVREIIEDYDEKEAAYKRYDEIIGNEICQAAYIYRDGEMIESFDRAYNEYLDRVAQEDQERRDAERRARGWG
jgi:hypothetical protein